MLFIRRISQANTIQSIKDKIPTTEHFTFSLDLAEMGALPMDTPLKSSTRQPLTLDDDTEQILGYICGIFEGNGHCHIRISAVDGHIELCTTSLMLINWLQQMMIALEVKADFRSVTRGNFELNMLSWSGTNAEGLLTGLAGAVNETKDRKWEGFLENLEPKKISNGIRLSVSLGMP